MHGIRTLTALPLPALSIAATGLTTALVPLGIQIFGNISMLGKFALVYAPLTAALAVQRLVLNQNVSRGISTIRIPGLVKFLLILRYAAVAASLAVQAVLGFEAWTLILTALVPIAMRQDYYRMVLFGRMRPRYALASDVVWLSGAALGFFAMYQIQIPWRIEVFLAFNLVSAAVAFLLCAKGASQLSLSDEVASAPLRPLIGEAVAMNIFAQVSPFLVAYFVGYEVVGAYRSVLLIFAPVALANTTIQLVIIARLDINSRRAVTHAAVGAAVACGMVSLLVVLARFLDPVGIFERLGFPGTTSFYWTALIVTLASSLTIYLTVFMVRARMTIKSYIWFRAQLWSAIVEPIVSIPCSLAFGAPGLASGNFISSGMTAAYLGMVDAHRSASKLVNDNSV